MKKAIIALLVLLILSACSGEPCTGRAKREYREAMNGYAERAEDTVFDATALNEDDIPQRLKAIRGHAADEPAPSCDGARDFRGAVLDQIDLLAEATEALLIEKDDIKAEELMDDYTKAWLAVVEAEEVLKKAPIQIKK